MSAVVRRLQAWARHRAALDRQSGITLVEILVTVAILSIAVVGIVSSLSTASLASDYHRKQATGDTVMKSFAEVLQQSSQRFGYADCTTGSATAVHYNKPALLAGWAPEPGYIAEVIGVQFGHAGSPWTFGACGSSDEGLQKLSLRVASDDGRDTETLDIIVRSP